MDKKNFLDDLIRKVLGNLEEPYDASTWDSLEKKVESMDEPVMEDGHFDSIVSGKLGMIDPVFEAEHWDLMNKALDQELLEPEMRDGDFDILVSQKLENINPEFESAHWDLMNQALDQELLEPELEDVYLDGVAYDNLNNLNSPYNPEHWEIMSDKLDEAFSLRRKLVKYKVAEIALLLLFLFTAGQFIPFNNNQFTGPVVPHKTDLKSETESSTELPASKSEVESSQQNLSSNQNVVALGETTNSISTEQENINANENSNLDAEAIGDSYVDFTYWNSNASSNTVEAANSNMVVSNDDEDEPKGSTTIVTSEEPNENVLLVNTEDSRSATDAVDHLNSLVQFASGTNVPGFGNCKDCLTKNNKPQLRFGTFASADLNHIQTGYNSAFDKAAYSRFAGGYGGGISIGLKTGKLELETGVIYSSTYYTPDSVNVEFNRGSLGQGGYVGEGIYAAQLDFVKIPLNAKYDLINWSEGKWRAYVLGGLSFNAAIQKNFLSRQYKIENRNNQREIASELFSEVKSPDYPGLLEEGGKLQGNHFFTANIGLGLERLLGNRWSIFAQPVYQHQFSGAQIKGPDNDRMNTLSLQFGTKVNFK